MQRLPSECLQTRGQLEEVDQLSAAIDEFEGEGGLVGDDPHGSQIVVVSNHGAGTWIRLEWGRTVSTGSVNKVREPGNHDSFVAVRVSGHDRGRPPRLEGPPHPIALEADVSTTYARRERRMMEDDELPWRL